MKTSKRVKFLTLVICFSVLIFTPIALVLAKPQNGSPDLQDNKVNQGKGQAKKLLLEAKGNKFKVTEIDDEDEKIDAGEGEELEEIEEIQVDVGEEEGEDQEEPVTLKAQNNAAFVIRNKLAAQTNFPLMVNLETNELIVNTPKGSKIVTILPDQAVANMLAANVLDQLGGKGGLLWLQSQPTPSVATPSATPTATVSATPSLEPSPTATASGEPTIAVESLEISPIRLVLTDKGVLVYEIDGIKTERFLGLFKIKLNRVVVVSAETGNLIEIQQNLLTKILDFLSL